MKFTYYDLGTLPRLHDIVFCRFPLQSDDGSPIKVRPALVLGTFREIVQRIGKLRVAYGTSNLKLDQRIKLDLIIQNSETIDRVGLRSATRFDLDRIVELPWCQEYFVPPTGIEGIVIGHLTETLIGMLGALKSIRAQAIAAQKPPQ